ncbi:hypothetical protein [Candidatus Nitrospira inopinata]|jgi:hypothetical protein|uniref:Uncharacterized protein n=1 Tax=Candidatus Nitrospira inopinata TaxID=1715989 RepID=A0A0S4KPV5_9BACT|nr:hypothetical protein [Candidatus Nitrospira inopinata]CUQ65328.1 protein of unknown function [Candidatus Nitrospira inopinata]
MVAVIIFMVPDARLVPNERDHSHAERALSNGKREDNEAENTTDEGAVGRPGYGGDIPHLRRVGAAQLVVVRR